MAATTQVQILDWTFFAERGVCMYFVKLMKKVCPHHCRSCGVTVITPDSESGNPSSNLGRTFSIRVCTVTADVMVLGQIWSHWDSVSEWLRRCTRNALGSARAGSNPAAVDFALVWYPTQQYGAFLFDCASQGCIAQWLERLTADQQVPGSTPGAPFMSFVRMHTIQCETFVHFCVRHRGISGLVVEYIVAIDVTRVRFPADAYYVLLECQMYDECAP